MKEDGTGMMLRIKNSGQSGQSDDHDQYAGCSLGTRKLESRRVIRIRSGFPVLTVRYTASDGKEAEFIVGDTNDAAGGLSKDQWGRCGLSGCSDFADSLIQISISWLTWKASDHHIRQHYRYQCEFEWPYTGDQERQ